MHYRDAGLPETFQILDSADQLSAIKRLLKALNVDDEKFPPRDSAALHQRQQGSGPARERSAEAWDDLDAPPKSRSTPSLRTRSVRSEGVVDFAELLLRSLRVADAQRSRCARTTQQPFSPCAGGRVPGYEPAAVPAGSSCWPVMAAPEPAAVFAVGDDDQSIYAFRGAERGQHAPISSASSRSRSVIRLEQNYRSHGNILDAANAIIANNSQPPGQEPVDRCRLGRTDPRVRGRISDNDEARWIVEESPGQLIRDGASRTRILRCSTAANAQSRVLEHAVVFNRHSVPGVWRPALFRAGRRSSTRSLTCA